MKIVCIFMGIMMALSVNGFERKPVVQKRYPIGATVLGLLTVGGLYAKTHTSGVKGAIVLGGSVMSGIGSLLCFNTLVNQVLDLSDWNNRTPEEIISDASRAADDLNKAPSFQELFKYVALHSSNMDSKPKKKEIIEKIKNLSLVPLGKYPLLDIVKKLAEKVSIVDEHIRELKKITPTEKLAVAQLQTERLENIKESFARASLFIHNTSMYTIETLQQRIEFLQQQLYAARNPLIVHYR